MKIVAKQKKECDIPKEHCNQHLNSFIHLCYYTFKAWNKYLFFFFFVWKTLWEKKRKKQNDCFHKFFF